MSDISDELRRLAHDEGVYGDACVGLRDLADRIDAETVELPNDRDGVPIHVGDTVYLNNGCEAKVYRIELTNGRNAIRKSITVDIQGLTHSVVVNIPSSLTHTFPDSWERIADELEEWCDRTDVDGDACEKPRDLAMRIRRLAQVRAHGAPVVR